MITASGRSIRNVVEAIVFFAFFVLLFAFLPIPLKIRIILIIIFGGPAAFFGFIGIHKYSVIEYLTLVIKFKQKPHNFQRDDMFKTDDSEEQIIVENSEENN